LRFEFLAEIGFPFKIYKLILYIFLFVLERFFEEDYNVIFWTVIYYFSIEFY